MARGESGGRREGQEEDGSTDKRRRELRQRAEKKCGITSVGQMWRMTAASEEEERFAKIWEEASEWRCSRETKKDNLRERDREEVETKDEEEGGSMAVEGEVTRRQRQEGQDQVKRQEAWKGTEK